MLCMVFRRVGSALRACGSLCSLAAALRPQAISPNIIVFVVCGLTFMNVSALDMCIHICMQEAHVQGIFPSLRLSSKVRSDLKSVARAREPELVDPMLGAPASI